MASNIRDVVGLWCFLLGISLACGVLAYITSMFLLGYDTSKEAVMVWGGIASLLYTISILLIPPQ